MPGKKYPFEEGGEKRLAVSWKPSWKGTEISCDGRRIGSINTKEELQQGQDFSLPDGSLLKVSLTKKGLELERNGKAVPGSASDPTQILRAATFAVFWIGGVTLILSFIGEIFHVEAFQELLGWEGIILGSLFIGLGTATRRGSSIALASAIFIYGVLLFLSIVMAIEIIADGGFPIGIGGLFLGIIFLITMIKGYKAIPEVREYRNSLM